MICILLFQSLYSLRLIMIIINIKLFEFVYIGFIPTDTRV